MEALFSQIANQAKQIANLWANLYSNLLAIRSPNGASLDLAEQVPGCSDSINQIGARLIGIYGVIGGLDGLTNDDLMLVPRGDLTSLLGNINNTIHLIENLTNITSPEAPNLVTFADGNPWSIISVNGTLLANLSDDFRNTEIQLDLSASIIGRSSSIILHVKKINFNGLTSIVSDTIRKISKLRDEGIEVAADSADAVKNLEEKIRANAETSDQVVQKIRNIQAEIETVQKSAESDTATIGEALTKVGDHLQMIETLVTQAAELRGAVNTYQANFNEFQKKLIERDNLFTAGSTQIQQLALSMKTTEDQLGELVDEAQHVVLSAKNALSWGSEAGLAGSFAAAAAEQDNKLKTAEIGFYISIAFMLALVGVAVGASSLFGLPNLAPVAGESSSTAFITLVAAGALRVLIVLPAWLTLNFTNSRYRSLMRMKEAYLFKKTIAAALPGFKETAAGDETPDGAKTITVAAFEHLLFNPQESESQRDDLDWLRKTPREVVIEALKTVREGMRLGTSTDKPDK